MPFPISTHGCVPIPADAASVSDEAIMLACADQIEHERARIVSRTDQQLRFAAPLFRTWTNGWWLTVAASHGNFTIKATEDGGRVLAYQLSTLRNTVIGTLVVLLGFGVMLPRMVPPPPFGWEIAILAWLWIVGANWATAAIRVRFWCRKRVADAQPASGALARNRGAAT